MIGKLHLMGKKVMPFFLKNTIFVARKILTTTDRHLLERAIFIGSCLFHHRWRSLYNSIGCWRTEPFKQVISQVGQGSPRPVLQHPNKFPHGGRGTETTVLLGNKQPHLHPLPVGEGSEYPCFLLEDGAQRPCSTMVCLVIRDAN